jgi:signal peptidase I
MKRKKQFIHLNCLQKIFKSLAVPLGCGLLFLFMLKCLFFVGYVPSASMEPTVRKDSIIFGVRHMGNYKVGDVVIFEHDGRLIVKRIAAVPGDNVMIKGKNDTVPEGCYYMLGDNPDMSVDSRYWDEPFISVIRIIAKVP